MSDVLDFDGENYEVKTCSLGENSVEYRAFTGIMYCANPAAPVQRLNLFVPELFYRGETRNGYTLHTAPIFMPNTVGGYMEGPADDPGLNRYGRPNAVFRALEHGYVVACAGVRGRTTGKRSTEFFEGAKGTISGEETGRMVGKAPALIVDMKAAVRYLRHNRDRLPGDTEHIITSGTSAGGALSALMGATGNHPDYEPYLLAIGAAQERDDVFAANCYCPIHNLENADSAYEWQFCGCREFYRTKRVKTENGVKKVPYNGVMTEKQMAVSEELKRLFPGYLNSLHLTGEDGEALTLDEDGRGSFGEYVKHFVMLSAQKELETHESAGELGWLSTAGSLVDEQDYLTVENGRVTGLDWERYVRKITRMKATPAFDAMDLQSPENEEFGTEEIPAKHFTAYAAAHSEAGGILADGKIIKMLNPLRYIGEADTSRYWRIRHGAFDRDTSLAIPVILAASLKNKGYDTDFFIPWGLPHSGDYDLKELFAWIDAICEK